MARNHGAKVVVAGGAGFIGSKTLRARFVGRVGGFVDDFHALRAFGWPLESGCLEFAGAGLGAVHSVAPVWAGSTCRGPFKRKAFPFCSIEESGREGGRKPSQVNGALRSCGDSAVCRLGWRAIKRSRYLADAIKARVCSGAGISFQGAHA